MHEGLEGRWYAGLIAPVRPQVTAALRSVAEDADQPFALPRAGLGGAVVVHVARGFGTRRWPSAARLGMLALESYNQRVYRAAPTQAARTLWLERDVAGLRRVWRGLVKRDEPLLRRVVDRMIGARTAPVVGDDAIPEAVLFLRAAVAAGVLAGNVPDGTHASLDAYVTWVGLAWEASQGTLTRAGWEGALRAVGRTEAYAADVVAVGTREARVALGLLPGGPAVDMLGGLLEQRPAEDRRRRDPVAWTPCDAPEPRSRETAGHAHGQEGAGDLEAFAADWKGAV